MAIQKSQAWWEVEDDAEEEEDPAKAIYVCVYIQRYIYSQALKLDSSEAMQPAP